MTNQISFQIARFIIVCKFSFPRHLLDVINLICERTFNFIAHLFTKRNYAPWNSHPLQFHSRRYSRFCRCLVLVLDVCVPDWKRGWVGDSARQTPRPEQKLWNWIEWYYKLHAPQNNNIHSLPCHPICNIHPTLWTALNRDSSPSINFGVPWSDPRNELTELE